MTDNLANAQKKSLQRMSKLSSKMLPCLLKISYVKIIISCFHIKLYIHHIK